MEWDTQSFDILDFEDIYIHINISSVENVHLISSTKQLFSERWNKSHFHAINFTEKIFGDYLK